MRMAISRRWRFGNRWLVVALSLTARDLGAFDVDVHEDITRRAMRRFPIPTLSVVSASNRAQDAVRNKYDARHFNDCAFFDASGWIRRQYQNTLDALQSARDHDETSCEFTPCPHLEEAAAHFGALLHTIQDFYAHSNWVSVAPDLGTGAQAVWRRHLKDPSALAISLPPQLAFASSGEFCRASATSNDTPQTHGDESAPLNCMTGEERDAQSGDFPLLYGTWVHQGWAYRWQDAKAPSSTAQATASAPISIYSGRVGNIRDGEEGGRCPRGFERGHWDRGAQGLHNDDPSRPNFARARTLAFMQTVYELMRLEFLLARRDPALLQYVRAQWTLGARLYEADDLQTTVPAGVAQDLDGPSFFAKRYHYGLQLGAGGWREGAQMAGGARAMLEQRLGRFAVAVGATFSSQLGLAAAVVYRYHTLGGISAGLLYHRSQWQRSSGAVNATLGYEVIPAGAVGGFGLWTVNAAFGLGYALDDRALSAQSLLNVGLLR